MDNLIKSKLELIKNTIKLFVSYPLENIITEYLDYTKNDTLSIRNNEILFESNYWSVVNVVAEELDEIDIEEIKQMVIEENANLVNILPFNLNELKNIYFGLSGDDKSRYILEKIDHCKRYEMQHNQIFDFHNISIVDTSYVLCLNERYDLDYDWKREKYYIIKQHDYITFLLIDLFNVIEFMSVHDLSPSLTKAT